jgi:hypothetical protein
MFQLTHLLISCSRPTPVQLVKSPQGFFLVTETEWQQHRQPAFEMRSQHGFFCQGIPVLGYSLQPLDTQLSLTASASAVTSV